MSTEAFSETLQFITNVKLQELDKRRANFAEHAAEVLREASDEKDAIEKLTILVDGMENWPGKWSSNLSRKDIVRWLAQAKSDPGFPPSVLQNWIQKAQAEFEHEGTRYEYAHLFGNLLTDWLKSSPTSRVATDSPSGSDGFEKVGRKETLEQKQKLESIIFKSKPIDVPALETYLKDLFAPEKASEALLILRARVKRFAESLRTRKIQASDVSNVISSALATDVLSDEKQALLKQFAKNNTVVEELASVLTMQLQSLQTWSWPQEGVLVEPRRHLNGKTRFYLDTEILTCLLLHFIGMSWAVEFRNSLVILKASSAWKESSKILTKTDLERRDCYVGEDSQSIVGARKEYQSKHFFMCQLPESFEKAVDHYGDERPTAPALSRASRRSRRLAADNGPRFDTPIDLKQSLLHILSADILVNESLHGSCTIVRTDLEWFGPSLPFDTIMTILRFFGMPEQELQFFQSFLSCPLLFKDDPSGPVRTRQRGVPISYMLSTLFGELSMFVMDFAVNQKADGLFLYRIHDDFWFCDWEANRCATAWEEMQRYASLAGLSFNASKTGSVCVGENATLLKELPVGDVRWGFLKMNEKGVFTIDQDMIDTHVVEMRRQLAATTSVFGWTQAYNKYMAFVVRNCGQPSMVYGKAHLQGIVEALAKIQRALFPTDGGHAAGSVVGAVAQKLEVKFKIDTSDIPMGWYLWPNSAGGLGVKDFFVDLFAMMDNYDGTPKEIIRHAGWKDKWDYESASAAWEKKPSYRRAMSTGTVSPTDPFMPFEEYIKAREERGRPWYDAYMKLLKSPTKVDSASTPQIDASIELLGEGLKAFGASSWSDLSPYWKWVIGVHHDAMVHKFGSLAVVEAGSIPVGMVDVFKGSRMRWEQ
ncbi:hypothetical protein SCHPADRAFT_912892 [Schizopora paradoxa]|uniref:Reverse transcriptase domain-containing protein n=1 Tax=Schizopora paradoxa TaxID=27342 RepID=A0A0H2SPV0_9AGAM|nr:hypothetical protein SCHPADRAFT_912892 [Schizopora paradoxa]